MAVFSKVVLNRFSSPLLSSPYLSFTGMSRGSLAIIFLAINQERRKRFFLVKMKWNEEENKSRQSKAGSTIKTEVETTVTWHSSNTCLYTCLCICVKKTYSKADKKMLSQPKHSYCVASQRVNHTLQYEVQQGDERVAEQRNRVYHLKEKVRNNNK